MRTGQCGKPPPRPSASLRSSFAWTLAGNGLYAAAQWATLSLAAKLGGSEMLGQYALAVALTTPLVMLSHLNLRAVLATDLDGRHPFGDYVAVRDRKSTRLNSSHLGISYAVFCLKKKNKNKERNIIADHLYELILGDSAGGCA